MKWILEGTELIVAWMTFLTSILFFMSPVKYIYDLYYKKANVEQFSGVHIFLSFIHCILWFSLGIEVQDNRLFWSHFIGVLLNFIWCVSYLNFFTEGKKMLFFAYLFSLINITIETIYFEGMLFSDTAPSNRANFKDNSKQSIKIFKWIISLVFNTTMYFTPGFNIKKLFKYRDNRYISIVSVYLGLLNAIVWFIYGFVGQRMKFEIVVANAIGILFCGFQIGIYYHFKHSVVLQNNNPLFYEQHITIKESLNDEISYNDSKLL